MHERRHERGPPRLEREKIGLGGFWLSRCTRRMAEQADQRNLNVPGPGGEARVLSKCL